MPERPVLLVTGANGFVAGNVLAEAGDSWEIHAVSRRQPPSTDPRWQWHTLDSLEPEAWHGLLRHIQPSAVIHTAAVADIDLCEARPDLATAVNVGLTRTLAGYCRSTETRLVHCSTDTVFDGEHAPYREEDPPGPVNHYARTKVEAEQLALDLGPVSVVARLAVVVGLPLFGTGNSFLSRMLAALRAGKEVTVPANEVRTPIDVITLARALLELAGDRRPNGLLHLGGNERVNRLDLARRIAVFHGFPPERIVPIDPTTLPGRANRPRDASMINTRARSLLRTPMLDLDAALSLIRDIQQSRGT
jgi:dTDP-4-dehydrorhamnose reductase